jgi:GTP-binding protein
VPATPGEQFELQLELKVLADVGLLGFPNAGKSTLISAVSAARPKVADYPFTTLYPNLGVVRIDIERSFVIADIPGLIEGAAEGTGLGIQFLKHLQRTRLLLQLVDLAPLALDVNPVEQVRQLELEMQKFDPGLMDKPRWLVFTKADLLPPGEALSRAEEAVAELGWEAPWMMISSVTHSGTDELMQRISAELELLADEEAAASRELPDTAEFPEEPFEP